MMTCGVEGAPLRKFMLSLGTAAAALALARLIFAPLFLAAPADHATALLLAGGVFTIALAAVVRD